MLKKFISKRLVDRLKTESWSNPAYVAVFVASLVFGVGVGANESTPETLDARVERLEKEYAEDEDNLVLKLELAKASHYLGIGGDAKAGERAELLLLELTETQPDDAVITAYYGSARLMKAARTWVIWKKGELAKEGIGLMNDAVDAAPDDPEVRFLRGASTYHLPGWFGLTEQAEDDFAIVVETAEADVEAGRLEEELAAAAFFHQALILEDDGKPQEAIEAWEIAARLAPHSRAGQDAEKELEKRR